MKGKSYIRKVQIISLIDTLKKIYDDGADFIDIEGKPSKGNEDVVKISVRPEYYTNPETGHNKMYDTDPEFMLTDEDFEDLFPSPLSDKDINDLIR
tara:strand:+ start:492 stop:779 length:288 start_codon:yes stop_codon:yes gene_type:complete